MTVKAPTAQQLRLLGERLGLSLDEPDLDSFLGLIGGLIDAYNVVDAMPDNLPEVRYPRTPGRRPLPGENPHNAWYVKTTVTGAPDGKLKGRRVVLKDNI